MVQPENQSFFIPIVAPKKEYPPFFTGSRVYGKPTVDSDYDLVLMVPNAAVRKTLYGALTQDEQGAWRSDKLNFIICICPTVYRVWWEGTQKMVADVRFGKKLYYTRDEAKAVFDELRDLYEIEDNYA